MPDIPTLATTPTPSAAPAAASSPAPAPSQQAAPAPVTPGSKAWAEMTTEQRHAQLRGPENPRARGHSPARDQREEAAARAPGEVVDGDDRANPGDPQTPLAAE